MYYIKTEGSIMNESSGRLFNGMDWCFQIKYKVIIFSHNLVASTYYILVPMR